MHSPFDKGQIPLGELVGNPGWQPGFPTSFQPDRSITTYRNRSIRLETSSVVR